MLAQLLKEKMQKENLSLRAAASEVGVSHVTIVRALKEEPLDLDTIIAISNWLGISPSVVLGTQGEAENALSDKIASVLEKEPRLKEVFEEAINRIERGEASSQLIEDIVSYAKYKLDMENVTGGGKE